MVHLGFWRAPKVLVMMTWWCGYLMSLCEASLVIRKRDAAEIWGTSKVQLICLSHDDTLNLRATICLRIVVWLTTQIFQIIGEEQQKVLYPRCSLVLFVRGHKIAWKMWGMWSMRTICAQPLTKASPWRQRREWGREGCREQSLVVFFGWNGDSEMVWCDWIIECLFMIFAFALSSQPPFKGLNSCF